MRTHLIVFAVVACQALTALSEPRHGDVKNLVKNGSFELETNKGIADGWYISQYRGKEWHEWAVLGLPDYVKEMFGRDNLPTIAVDPTVAAHGKKSLKVVNPSKRLMRSPVHIDVPIESATTNTFSFFARCERDTMPLKVEFGNVTNQSFTITDQWQPYVFTFAVGKNFPGRTHIFIHNGVPGIYWIDAAQLEQGAQSHPYVEHEATAQKKGE